MHSSLWDMTSTYLTLTIFYAWPHWINRTELFVLGFVIYMVEDYYNEETYDFVSTTLLLSLLWSLLLILLLVFVICTFVLWQSCVEDNCNVRATLSVNEFISFFAHSSLPQLLLLPLVLFLFYFGDRQCAFSIKTGKKSARIDAPGAHSNECNGSGEVEEMAPKVYSMHGSLHDGTLTLALRFTYNGCYYYY